MVFFKHFWFFKIINFLINICKIKVE